MYEAPGPCVIGATGGSGTRVVARAARLGGLFLGKNRNASEDALDVAAYLDRWINVYVPNDGVPVPSYTWTLMIKDLKSLVNAHCSQMEPAHRAWGWKEPRSIYLLPFFDLAFPNFKFLHVVRDGRDMALSENQNQLRKHGRALLGPAGSYGSELLESIALWNRINLLAANYGEQCLAERYLRVRFEDLCAEPIDTVQRIFTFFSLEGDVQQIAQSGVSPPDSLGRWRTQDEQTLAEFHQIAGEALRRFGYE